MALNVEGKKDCEQNDLNRTKWFNVLSLELVWFLKEFDLYNHNDP